MAVANVAAIPGTLQLIVAGFLPILGGLRLLPSPKERATNRPMVVENLAAVATPGVVPSIVKVSASLYLTSLL